MALDVFARPAVEEPTSAFWRHQLALLHELTRLTGSAPTFNNVMVPHIGPRALDRMVELVDQTTGCILIAPYEVAPGERLSDAAATWRRVALDPYKPRQVILAGDGYGIRRGWADSDAKSMKEVLDLLLDSGVDVRLIRDMLRLDKLRLPDLLRPRSRDIFRQALRRELERTDRLPFEWRLTQWLSFAAVGRGAHGKCDVFTNSDMLGELGEGAVALERQGQIDDAFGGDHFYDKYEHYPTRRGNPVPFGPVYDEAREIAGPAVRYYLYYALIRMALSGSVSWHDGEFRADRPLESDRERVARFGKALEKEAALFLESPAYAWQPGGLQVVLSQPVGNPRFKSVAEVTTETAMRMSDDITIIGSVLHLSRRRLNMIKQLRKNGVRITFVVNREDPPHVRLAAVQQYERLMQMGVHIREFNRGRLHTKLYLCEKVLDHELQPFAAIRGSMQEHYRAMHEDSECGKVILDPGDLQFERRRADFYLEHSDEITRDMVPGMERQLRQEVELNPVELLLARSAR